MYKILLLSLLSLLSSTSSEPILLAYIPSWVTKYDSSCNLNLDNLNVNYFTHLTIPFVTFDTTNFAVSAMNNDDTSGWYNQVKGLKSRNGGIKVLISVGGGSFGGDPWAEMIKTSDNRNKFITNIISFSRSNSFDGIDIDWEAPNSTTQTAGIKSFFSELRSAVTNDATSSGKPALLLTIASPNYKDAIDIFNFADTHQYLDWINVMSYDYYGDWSTVVGANTAFSGNNNLDITSTISYFGGVPSSKLVMGFANYARTFILSSANNHSPGSSLSSVGSPGPCTSSPGTLSYSELYSFLSSFSSGTYAFDTVSKTPYFYSGTQWVTYDNKQSLQIKMDYINNNGLGGAMVWALDGNSSLTDFIAKELGSSSTLTTSPCTTTTGDDSSASALGASCFVFIVLLISILY